MAAPISRKQEEFLRAEDRRINLLSGSVRSGKTYISLIKWALFVGSMPSGAEFLMCGKTVTALKRNCLILLEQLVGSNNFRYSLSQKSGTLFGRRVWLEGANDERSESKIRGMTLAGAYCDELTLFPQGFYSMLLSRLSERGAKLYATTNPDAPTHWVYEDIIKNTKIDSAVWKFLIEENNYLDPEYVANQKLEHAGVFYDRYILGEWVRAEGGIYPLFANNTDRCLVDKPPEDVVQVNIGVDFGGNKSASVFTATGLTRGFKRVVVLAEEYRPAGAENPNTLSAAFVDFCRNIKKRYPMCANAFCDSAEKILIRGLRVAIMRADIGIEVRDARKGPIVGRIRLTNSLIGTDRFRVLRSCTHLIRSLQDAVWDERKQDDARLDDGTYNVDSLDSFEYAIEPWAGYLQVAKG